MAGERVFRLCQPDNRRPPRREILPRGIGHPHSLLTFSLVTCYITNNFTQAVKRRVHDRRLAKRAPTW